MYSATVILVGLLAIAGACLMWIRRRETQQREALSALAARRGLTLQVTPQSLGRPSLMRLSSRGGPEWTVQSRGGGAASAPPLLEFAGQEPVWRDGYVFIASEAFLDRSQRDIVGDGMGADLSGLEPFETDQPLTIYATTSPRLRVDLGDMARLWQQWPDRAPGITAAPIAMLGPEGLRLQLRSAVWTADQMEAFIDMALDVGRTIGPQRG